jgi:hypothetical protein
LSWNEIRDHALRFSREWADESSEDAQAKSFWDAFFNVFGVTRRRLASFEQPVKKVDGKGGSIDLLWKGILLVEYRSRSRDIDRVFKQNSRRRLHRCPGPTRRQTSTAPCNSRIATAPPSRERWEYYLPGGKLVAFTIRGSRVVGIEEG